MNKTKTENILFYFILFLATFVRFYKLGEIPLGVQTDEAYSGYEAFSLLTTGHDSWGYNFPMYFISWGSGMNAIYAYLTMPFVALFGLTSLTIRLPQAIFSLLSCYIFYRLLRLMFARPTALLGFFLSAIIPWQLLIVRRGLEANIAPFFILAGFYFFARSIKNKDYLLLSAVFYGLGLYAYATAWIFIMLTFGFQLTYLTLYKKKQTTTLMVIISGLVFTMLALPIALFILVNNNILPEITTSYFSIPKLMDWRQNEIGFNNLPANMLRIFSIIITGHDGLLDNAFPPYGIFYPVSLPFMLYGLYVLLKNSIIDVKTHQFSLNLCILVSLCFGLLYCTTFETYINRANFLWFFFLISIVGGLYPLINKPFWRNLIIAIYLTFFICFSHTFLTRFNSMVTGWFNPDFKPVLEIAETTHQQTSLPIKILELPYIHPKVLFYTKTPTNEYTTTVKRQKSFFHPVASFTHFYFNPDTNYENPKTDAIYIAPAERRPFFHKFNTRVIGTYLVAIPKQTSQPL